MPSVTCRKVMSRIHTVILTRDRPTSLRRCIETALRTMGPDDELTVLDDSSPNTSRINSEVLSKAARCSVASLTLHRAEQLFELVRKASNGQIGRWQSKTAHRDIAPLRNLSLLLSTTIDSQTTVLVDDDICGYDLEATHRTVDERYRTLGPLIVGAKIGGTTELDTVSRITDAMCQLASKPNYSANAAGLFRAIPCDQGHRFSMCEYLSAGYLAFRLPIADLFAFPPGYNEDWLWCLLHGANNRVHLVRDDQEVEHDPPELRKSSREDIFFEIAGDLVFDCLTELREPWPSTTDEVLSRLADFAPDSSMMPLVRVDTALKQAEALSEDGYSAVLTDLDSYGLGVLRSMLRSGELELDGVSTLRAWSVDAVAKSISFARTLGDFAVRHALREATQEGKKQWRQN
jgi:hypothetical protein